MKLTDFATLEALEKQTGIDRTHLSSIFNGRPISEQTITRIAIALEVSKSEAYKQIEDIRATKKRKIDANR